MKRVAVMVASTIAFVTMASAAALADYTESENVVQGAGGVAGNGGADVAALTGADTSTAAIMVVALVAVGLVALLMSRPRVAQTS